MTTATVSPSAAVNSTSYPPGAVDPDHSFRISRHQFLGGEVMPKHHDIVFQVHLLERLLTRDTPSPVEADPLAPR
ncbi:MAG: hypothetical protein ACRDVN_04210 [Jiangellaceae bacterium]